MEECPICKNLCAYELSRENGDKDRTYDCKRCGVFRVSWSLSGLIDTIGGGGNEKERMYLSSWLRENSGRLNPIIVTRDFFEDTESLFDTDAYRFKHTSIPSVDEKLNKLLLYLGDKSEYLGDHIDSVVNNVEGFLFVQAITWSINEDEYFRLLVALKEMCFIDLKIKHWVNSHRVDYSSIKLTVEGWRKYEKLNTNGDLLNQKVKEDMGMEQNKKGMIFISHSEKDGEYAKLILKLLRNLGVTEDKVEIICTSENGTPHCEDILSYLKEKMNKDAVVIYLLSKKFYSSAFSLCEMGAAWALSKKQLPILIPPFGFKDIKGVLPNTISGFLINDKKEWNKLRDETIKNLFGIEPQLKSTQWEEVREEFLEKIEKLLEAPENIETPQNVVKVETQIHTDSESDRFNNFFQRIDDPYFPQNEEFVEELIKEIKACDYREFCVYILDRITDENYLNLGFFLNILIRKPFEGRLSFLKECKNKFCLVKEQYKIEFLILSLRKYWNEMDRDFTIRIEEILLTLFREAEPYSDYRGEKIESGNFIGRCFNLIPFNNKKQTEIRSIICKKICENSCFIDFLFNKISRFLFHSLDGKSLHQSFEGVFIQLLNQNNGELYWNLSTGSIKHGEFEPDFYLSSDLSDAIEEYEKRNNLDDRKEEDFSL